ncbi:MAG: hypothetical protein LBU13_01340, partial [Synergistaceae bacterium]|nr:hypothetical protein [Synergistaceae bacterium]
PERALRRNIKLDDDVRSFLADAMKNARMSGRGFSRILRVAQTISDLEGTDKISVRHVAEGMSYREEAAFGHYGWRK